MGQTLSRAPAASDVLFAHLWRSVLEEAAGRLTEEQTDSCCRQKSICWQRWKPSSQLPLALLTPPPSRTSGASCDLLGCPGEGRCLCSTSTWWLGGRRQPPQVSAAGNGSGGATTTGSVIHFPVLKTDSPFLRSRAAGLTACDLDRSFTQQISWGQPLLRKPCAPPFLCH